MKNKFRFAEEDIVEYLLLLYSYFYEKINYNNDTTAHFKASTRINTTYPIFNQATCIIR